MQDVRLQDGKHPEKRVGTICDRLLVLQRNICIWGFSMQSTISASEQDLVLWAFLSNTSVPNKFCCCSSAVILASSARQTLVHLSIHLGSVSGFFGLDHWVQASVHPECSPWLFNHIKCYRWLNDRGQVFSSHAFWQNQHSKVPSRVQCRKNPFWKHIITNVWVWRDLWGSPILNPVPSRIT